MMISYSVTAILVDILQPHAGRPLTEAEIEAGGHAALRVVDHEVQPPRLRSWFGRINRRLLGSRAVGTASISS